MIGAPNIIRLAKGSYLGENSFGTWRITRKGRRWTAKNGRKVIFAPTLPALGGRLRALDGQLRIIS